MTDATVDEKPNLKLLFGELKAINSHRTTLDAAEQNILKLVHEIDGAGPYIVGGTLYRVRLRDGKYTINIAKAGVDVDG